MVGVGSAHDVHRGRRYNPLSYHNGTVWPHEISVAALAGRYARWPEAQRITQRMMTASQLFSYQLPEVFAGMRRSDTPFRSRTDRRAPAGLGRGNAGAVASPVLGLQPDRRRHALETARPSIFRSWAGTIRLAGVCAFDKLWDARLDDGRVRVEEA